MYTEESHFDRIGHICGTGAKEALTVKNVHKIGSCRPCMPYFTQTSVVPPRGSKAFPCLRLFVITWLCAHGATWTSVTQIQAWDANVETALLMSSDVTTNWKLRRWNMHNYITLMFYNLLSDVDVIVKFSQMEFKFGEVERGKTMFENVLSNYPKRTDIWSVYLDMMIKTGDVEATRWESGMKMFSIFQEFLKMYCWNWHISVHF